MVNNQLVKTIVDLKKKGVNIYLTDDGYIVFLKLMQEDLIEIEVRNII